MSNKKETTLEEFAEKLARAFDNDNYKALMDLVIDGAKWQQEQDKNKFNEEDMRASYNAENEGWVNFDFWFKQFKKK